VTVNRFVERLKESRFLRFGIVGACGFVVDTFVLYLLHRRLGLDPYSARAISIFTAMNFTWMGNRLITFRAHAATTPSEMAGEWARFLLTNALGAAINYAVYAAIVRFAPPPVNNPFVGLAAGVAVGLAFNFTLSKRVVFRAPPAE